MNKPRAFFRLTLFLSTILIISGCSYKAYMGMHGSSVKLHPDIHDNITQDKECLDCHHPDIAEGPATPHPGFKGCIKCHSDEV